MLEGFPGNYTMIASVGGAISSLMDTFSCPNPVARLTSQPSWAPAFSCATFGTACPGNDTCSAHGTCHCGVCTCQFGWTSAPDCSERDTDDDDPFVFDCGESPVLEVGSLLPSWIIGDVLVTNSSDQPVEVGCSAPLLGRTLTFCCGVVAQGVSVQLHARTCSGLAADHLLQIADSPCPEFSSDTSFSQPSVGGVAKYTGMQLFITRAVPGCYAFTHTFFGTYKRDASTTCGRSTAATT